MFDFLQHDRKRNHGKDIIMQVKDIMTEAPACCTGDTKLQGVAQLMCEHNCGEIPVVDGKKTLKPIGVITDRDIVCRTIGKGRNPLEVAAKDCMTKPAITVTPETGIEQCCQLMEQHQIRRIPVVDQDGACCGIVAQADVARCVPEHEAATLVKGVSLPAPQKVIQERAYQLFIERGRQPGRDFENWILAEQELARPRNARSAQLASH
jgi:CBS domain-containing protein